MFSSQIRKLISFYLLLQFPIVYCDANRRTASIPMKVKITGHCFDICFHFFLFFRLLFFDVVMIVLSCGRWMWWWTHTNCVSAPLSLSLSLDHITHIFNPSCVYFYPSFNCFINLNRRVECVRVCVRKRHIAAKIVFIGQWVSIPLWACKWISLCVHCKTTAML